MKCYIHLLSFCVLTALPSFAVTHDDSERIYPEILVWFIPTRPVDCSGGACNYVTDQQASSGAALNVEIQAYDGTVYVENITPAPLYPYPPLNEQPWYAAKVIARGMPLDSIATVKVTGQNVLSYSITVNVPDQKYVPCWYMDGPGEGAYLVTERNHLLQLVVSGFAWIWTPYPTGAFSWIVPGSGDLLPWEGTLPREAAHPLPHEHKLFFKRAGEAGDLPAKASSAMAGWRNFKMSLGSGKTGKSLGYVNFWEGQDPRLSDVSLELKTGAYSCPGSSKSYYQIVTPATTFEFAWDGAAMPEGFDPGEYSIRAYDNATQSGLRINCDGKMIYPETVEPFAKYVIHYQAPPEEENGTSRTRISRTEGGVTLVSEARRKYNEQDPIVVNGCFPQVGCVMLPTGPLCFPPPSCFPVVLRNARGVVRDFSYDWVEQTFTGARIAKGSVDRVVIDPVSGEGTRTVDMSVGLSSPGDFSFTQTDTRRQEVPSLNMPFGNGYFWRHVSAKTDFSESGTAAYKDADFQYYWAPDTGRHLKLKSRIEVDGSWTYYEYSDDRLSRGLITRVVRPFGDTPSTPANADTASGVLVTDYTYTYDWDGSRTLPATIVTRLRGENQIIESKAFEYWEETHDNLPVTVTVQHEDTAPGQRLTKVSKRFRADALRPFAHLPVSEQQPNGTKTVWKYSAGLFDESTFEYVAYEGSASIILNSPSLYGDAAIQTWKFTCFPATAPGAIALGVDNSFVVPNRSTAERMTRDKYGRLRQIDTFVCVQATEGGIAFDFLESERHFYDPAGNLVQTYKLSGTSYLSEYEATYQNGRKVLETDRGGVTKHFSYDAYGRVARIVETNSTGIAGLNTPPSLQTTFTYDCDHRVLSTTVGPRTEDGTPAVGALTSSTTYTRSGLPKAEIGPNGYPLEYDYTDAGQRKLTKIKKGVGDSSYDQSFTTTRWRDGRIKSVSGDAAVESYHSYSIADASGAPVLREVVSVGDETAHTSRKRTSDYDWGGRIVRVTESNPTGIPEHETKNAFNAKGQLVRTEVTGLAPVLSEYDQFGQLSRAGMKLSAGSALTLASTDRITDQTTVFEKDADGVWWEKSVSKTYPELNSAAPVTVQEIWTRRSEFGIGTVNLPQQGDVQVALASATVVKDASGNEVTTAIWYNRALGFSLVQTTMKSATSPDNLGSINGRVVYHLSSTGERRDYVYDAFGRLWKTTDRTGVTEMFYRAGSGELQWRRNPDNTWVQFGYDPVGRVSWQKMLAAKSATKPADTAAGLYSRFSYNKRNQLTRTWGDIPYPTEYLYWENGQQAGFEKEVKGQLWKVNTFRDGSSWANVTWPGTEPTASTVRFKYFKETGLLQEKAFLKNTLPTWQAHTYTYNSRRQLATRTWDRGLSTTYLYREAAGENTGELRGVDYSELSDTDLTYAYTRLGALASVIDAGGTRQFFYRANDRQLDYEQLPSMYGPALELGRQYDGFGRPTGFWMGNSPSAAILEQGYSYDPLTGRLKQITSGIGAFRYEYLPNSSLISSLVGPQLAERSLNHVRTYAPDSDLLATWTSTLGAETIAALAFRYDDLHRLTRIGQTGRLYQPYGSGLSILLNHNNRNELNNATAYLAGSPDAVVPNVTAKLPRRSFTFQYDNAGNRESETTDVDLACTYSPNLLGQYTDRARCDFVEVNGLIKKDTTLTAASVNGTSFTLSTTVLDPTHTDQNYFYGKAPRLVANQADLENISITTTLSGSGTPRLETRQVVAPPQTENFVYDADGNLTADALWSYTYDSENRLKQVETLASLPSNIPRVRLKFAYDFLGRRIKKEVWNYTAGNWVLGATSIFAYNGWNLAAEYKQNGANLELDKSFFWGLDLSGSIEGAAGVGGLLGLKSHVTSPGTYFAVSDANGNVTALLDESTGYTAAAYEYSPYGEILRSSGPLASLNPLRFSSKYFDSETRLMHFGYRFYSPSLGRFLTRDPLDEPGRGQLLEPVTGAALPVWGYVGDLVRSPGASRSLTPDTSLSRTSLPHSNDRQTPYRNSTDPDSTILSRKGSGSVVGPLLDGFSPQSSPSVAVHLYPFVQNSPYLKIDPWGLEDAFTWYNPFTWSIDGWADFFYPHDPTVSPNLAPTPSAADTITERSNDGMLFAGMHISPADKAAAADTAVGALDKTQEELVFGALGPLGRGAKILPSIGKKVDAPGYISRAWNWMSGWFKKGDEVAEAVAGNAHALNAQSTSPYRVLNIGGEGEIKDAVNLNDLSGASKTADEIATKGILVVGDMRKMPFPDNYFPEIVGNRLPFYEGDWAAGVASEAYRVLQPGGTVMLHSTSWGGQPWIRYLEAAGFVDIRIQGPVAVGVKR